MVGKRTFVSISSFTYIFHIIIIKKIISNRPSAMLLSTYLRYACTLAGHANERARYCARERDAKTYEPKVYKY